MSDRDWQRGADALNAVRAHVEERTTALRNGTRGLLLPMFTWPSACRASPRASSRAASSAQCIRRERLNTAGTQ